MRIAAVLIIYHPSASSIQNIQTYYNHVEKIFVFDNTELKSAIEDELRTMSKIEYHHNFRNEGISKRLNEGCRIATEQGFEWVLTMDQDTTFLSTSISKYFHCFRQYQPKENVAMFGTRYHRELTADSDQCQAEEVDELITSGTLLNLSVYKKNGDFDEALFIDSVDHDYCVRVKLAGYSIIRFSNICILHQLGRHVHRSSVKSLFFIRKTKMVHSPVRYYYMYRNLLYLEKKYAAYDLPLLKKIRKSVMHHIQVFLFYGRNTLPLLRYLAKGYFDFKNSRMGKIPGK